MPAGRPPKPIDPTASAAAALGFEIRSLRLSRGWTLDDLALRVGYRPQHISSVELAQTTYSLRFVEALDAALEAGSRLVELYPEVLLERSRQHEDRASRRRAAATVDDDVRRRAFLRLGLAVVLLGPDAAARASTNDWERIAHRWSYELTTTPDRSVLLPGLLADLRRLRANGGPQRAIAQLSSYVATIVVSTGDPTSAGPLWRAARAAADASGDAHLAASVTGLHAVEGIFGMHPPTQVLDLADDALAVTDAPCVGRMHALVARVRALALQGRRRETRDALITLEATFERLPRDITREKISVDGWAEEDLHNACSFASAFAGVGNGEAARGEALRLYSSDLWRGPASIRLHRAMAERDANLALDALAPLSEAQRNDRFVRLVSLRTLASCEEHRVAGASDLRAALTRS